MKRIYLYAALLATLTLAPKSTADVGELLPVELISIYRVGSEIHVETDLGLRGLGESLEDAMKDLRSMAPGKVFLDTADYLILAPETLDLAPELLKTLRPATQVCLGLHTDAGAAQFLSAHAPGVTLAELRTGHPKLPILTQREAVYHLAF